MRLTKRTQKYKFVLRQNAVESVWLLCSKPIKYWHGKLFSQNLNVSVFHNSPIILLPFLWTESTLTNLIIIAKSDQTFFLKNVDNVSSLQSWWLALALSSWPLVIGQLLSAIAGTDGAARGGWARDKKALVIEAFTL